METLDNNFTGAITVSVPTRWGRELMETSPKGFPRLTLLFLSPLAGDAN